MPWPAPSGVVTEHTRATGKTRSTGSMGRGGGTPSGAAAFVIEILGRGRRRDDELFSFFF
jgi:hypothetical protein